MLIVLFENFTLKYSATQAQKKRDDTYKSGHGRLKEKESGIIREDNTVTANCRAQKKNKKNKFNEGLPI